MVGREKGLAVQEVRVQVAGGMVAGAMVVLGMEAVEMEVEGRAEEGTVHSAGPCPAPTPGQCFALLLACCSWGTRGTLTPWTAPAPAPAPAPHPAPPPTLTPIPTPRPCPPLGSPPHVVAPA